MMLLHLVLCLFPCDPRPSLLPLRLLQLQWPLALRSATTVQRRRVVPFCNSSFTHTLSLCACTSSPERRSELAAAAARPPLACARVGCCPTDAPVCSAVLSRLDGSSKIIPTCTYILLFYASDTPFSIASARLCGRVWRMDRLLHPMGRPTYGWWPRRSQALRSLAIVSPVPLQASLALAQRAFALPSPGRGALCKPRWGPPANSPVVRLDTPRMPAARLLPSWRARRATPRGFSRSPLANGACARDRARRRMEERGTTTSSTSFHNFYLGMHYR